MRKTVIVAVMSSLVVIALLSMAAFPATTALQKSSSLETAPLDSGVTGEPYIPSVQNPDARTLGESTSISVQQETNPGLRSAAYPASEDISFRPHPIPQRESMSGTRSTRAPEDSYIFYDDFESGTDGWTIADLNSASGYDYWAATADRPGYGDYSLYCAGVGAVAGQQHTIFYDTAEYPIGYFWGTGDADPADVPASWARSSNKTYSGNYSYHVAGTSPGTGTNTLFADALESGATGWTHGIYTGTADSWALGNPTVGPAPRSGTNCWGTNLAGNYADSEDSFLKLPVLDARGYSTLSLNYYQYTDFEGTASNWDGGIIENRTGGNWYHVNTPSTNPSPYYDAALSTSYGNPLGGYAAYCYDNLAWRNIIANLNPCAGKNNVGIRFGLGTDDSGGAPGWYIDDVRATGTGPQYRSSMSSYMITTLDLTANTGCELTFQQWLALEDFYDLAYVKVSTTPPTTVDGPEWTTLATYGNTADAGIRDNGYDPNDYDANACKWEAKTLSLSAYDGSEIYLMFLMESDGSVAREGWYIDEIKVTGYGKSYDNYMDTYADTTVDLTGYTNAYLSFIYWMDAEDYYDVFNVSVKRSTDTAWTPILILNDGDDEWQYDGEDPDIMARTWWYTGHLSLDGFCGASSVTIRFWFNSDYSMTREGMYIDEVEVASIFFFDDMESGLNGWTTTSPVQPNWHQVNNDYYSYDTSWWCGSDVSGQYGGSMDEYLMHSFDLRTAEAARLRFLLTGHAYASDYLFIGITMDEGENWDYYGGLTGSYSGWWQFEIDLTPYLHKEAIVAFNLYTNKTQNSTGFWIDDVTIYGTRDRTSPGQVAGLQVVSGVEGESLALVWDANIEIDLCQYLVYRALVPGGPYEHVANATTNSYLDQGLTRDTTYYYIVTAMDFAGNEGPSSIEAWCTTVDTMPPAPVQDVEATDLQQGGIVNVSWLPNSENDLAGYKLYYSTGNFTDTAEATYYPLSPEDDAGATYWEIYGLENYILYHFAVTAIDKSGNENNTIEKTAIAIPTDQLPPFISITYPANSSTVSGTVNITVEAGDSSGITGVRIYINKGDPVEATYDHFLRKWVYQWDSTTVPDGEVIIEAEASDIYNNTAMDTVTVTKETVEAPYLIDLSSYAGDSWAFISFPIAISGNIQDILNDTVYGDGNTTWSVAKWYDGVTKTWKTYRHGSTTNTLFTIDNQMGVWIKLTANGGDKMLTTGIMGYYPTEEVQIQLYTGWNMVGYPSILPELALDALQGTSADMV
ncbi:MAG: immune inhibitor A, partial [Candidatus Thermoplasmatota archaeon]|nr:immune inhibitor A [Candidatus Thermoplasmatota archaeon]